MDRVIGCLVIASWILLFGGASRATIFVMMVAWYVVIAVLLGCGAVRYLRSGSHTAIDTRSEERL